MRRRPPHFIKLTRTDRAKLQALVCNGATRQRIARRARVLLEMGHGSTLLKELAERAGMSPNGIWCLCRRYDERGLAAVWDAERSGRPRQFSPLGSGARRATGLL